MSGGAAAVAVPEGLLLVRKPPGVTSHDVVQVVRRKLGVRRIGHTGTLDPMAQGLLLLLIGRATRHQREFQTHDKVYEARLRLGTQTDTGDATGTVIRRAPVPAVDPQHAAAVLAAFEGPLVITPPSYSAVKFHGRPAYWWARRHQPVTLAPRRVMIHRTTLLGCGEGVIQFRVHCSAGTYLRSMVESLAERLGTVGHLEGLTRVQVGRWSLADALVLDWIEQAAPEAVRARVLPVPTPA
jgi:tRNA pseudouridine55 synthase